VVAHERRGCRAGQYDDGERDEEQDNESFDLLHRHDNGSQVREVETNHSFVALAPNTTRLPTVGVAETARVGQQTAPDPGRQGAHHSAGGAPGDRR